MATTRAESKAKTAESKADDKTTTDDKATQEQTNTGSDEQTKAASADSSTADKATGDDAKQDIATDKDQSGHTSEDIEDVLDADAPEEELDTEYLPGGEIPVSAPGTEGLPRE